MDKINWLKNLMQKNKSNYKNIDECLYKFWIKKIIYKLNIKI